MTKRIASSPVRLIERFGKSVTYKKKTLGSYNVQTSRVEPATEVNYNIKAYKTDVSYRESQSPNIVGKSSVVFLIAGSNLGFIPNIQDLITDTEDTYQVMMLSKVEVNDVVALWRVVCVKS